MRFLSLHIGMLPVTLTHMTQLPGFLFPGNDGMQYSLNCFDTRGFMDSHFSFLEMVDDWNTMVKNTLTEVHHVVFVLPIDRYSKSTIEELAKMVNQLTAWGMKSDNVVVLLNKRDFWSEEVIARYTEEFRSSEILPPLLREAFIIQTCFMNLEEVEAQVRDLIKPRVDDSRDLLLDKLLTSGTVNPFHPRRIQLEQEEAALAARLNALRQRPVTRPGGACSIC